jgi:uncharacterized protein YneF (UPF0154 family)
MNLLIIIILILSILVLIAIPLYLIYLFYTNSLTNNPQFTNIHNGCLYTRYGCCNDKLTPKLDPFGSNCRGF